MDVIAVPRDQLDPDSVYGYMFVPESAISTNEELQKVNWKKLVPLVYENTLASDEVVLGRPVPIW
jgi:hypothetical protein